MPTQNFLQSLNHRQTTKATRINPTVTLHQQRENHGLFRANSDLQQVKLPKTSKQQRQGITKAQTELKSKLLNKVTNENDEFCNLKSFVLVI